jgi:hypothetical protein
MRLREKRSDMNMPNRPTIHPLHHRLAALCLALLCAGATTMRAATNNWIDGSGKWETPGNWSLTTAPSSSDSADLITNAGNNTVTIDATTTNTPATLTINNLTISANTLQLTNAGTGTPLQVLSQLIIGNTANATGTLLIAGGQLQMPVGGLIRLGNSGAGLMTVSGGVQNVYALVLGSAAGSAGTLTIDSGGMILSNTIGIGFSSASATGTVWLKSGEFTTPVNPIIVGYGGVGQLILSNGTLRGLTVEVGNFPSSPGTVTIAGGTHSITNLIVGQNSGAIGGVWLTGGVLTNRTTTVGDNSGSGQITVSNATMVGQRITVGSFAGKGTMTIAAGASSFYSNMTVGSFACTATGTVIVAGGELDVTNATHNAVLDVESGALTLSGGTLVVDILVKTNPCASFQQTGGTLVVGGVTNIVVPPLFSITAISRSGNNIQITWQSPGGVTNAVQAANGGPGGSYNTNFNDLASFILTGNSPITTNYLDIGGATNFPARYYRVRLVP